MKSEYRLKICIIGSCNKLKTQFVRHYAEDKSYENHLPTLGWNISTKKIKVGETQTILILVDTASQEIFGKSRSNIYRGASACIIIFDKSDRKTFDLVPDWLEEFKKSIPSPEIPIALVGINTKEETVSEDEGKALAELLDLPYFETSSPKFENSVKVFEYLAEQVLLTQL